MVKFHSIDSLVQGIETIISNDAKRRKLSDADLQILNDCKEVLKKKNSITVNDILNVVSLLLKFFEIFTS